MLSDTEINIAIAQACGTHGPWVEEVTPCACRGNWALYNQAGIRLPDYCNDLDEMADCMATLTDSEQVEFDTHLDNIMQRDVGNGWFAWQAKARQWAEAFLKTKGLWHD